MCPPHQLYVLSRQEKRWVGIRSLHTIIHLLPLILTISEGTSLLEVCDYHYQIIVEKKVTCNIPFAPLCIIYNMF